MTYTRNEPLAPPDSESVFDRLDRLEREATAGPWERSDSNRDGPWGAAGNVVVAPASENPSLPGIAKPWVASTGLVAVDRTRTDAALIALSRNHLRALLDVARAAEKAVSELETWLPSHSSERLRRDLSASLDPLLTTPSEQKEET